MKRNNLTRSLVLRLVALSLCLAAAAQARASEKESVLRASEREFGAAVDAQQNLFEVNASFVLQVTFDARGALDMMYVAPKYFFEEAHHPEWAEPSRRVLLSRSEFAAVLARIDSVRPRGRWLWSSGSSVVTNSTHYFTDEYEHAFVERGDYADIGVRFVSVYFMREVAGVVARKHRCAADFHGLSGHILHHVTVGGCGYFVGRATFARLRVGRRSRFRAAGPMGARCGVRNACGR